MPFLQGHHKNWPVFRPLRPRGPASCVARIPWILASPPIAAHGVWFSMGRVGDGVAPSRRPCPPEGKLSELKYLKYPARRLKYLKYPCQAVPLCRIGLYRIMLFLEKGGGGEHLPRKQNMRGVQNYFETLARHLANKMIHSAKANHKNVIGS